MADEILNTLGFSVDEALAALRNLDSALQMTGTAFNAFGAAIDSFNARAQAALATIRGLASAAGRLSAATQNMGATAPAAPAAASASQLWLPPGVQSAAQQTAAAMTNIGTAAQQAGQQAAGAMNQTAAATANAKTHGDALIVSWNTIARVVMTQAIVRALSMFRDALKEAVSAAEDFQVRLAEIQTIAPRIGEGLSAIPTSMQSLASEVTNFSKEFNIPMPQVQEGLYQTLSNQFTTIADRANVMDASMKLAKVGVMDFQSAVLLITGTLNAYGMSSSEAESVAMKFFETIHLGRVRGKELADTMGQVIPIASELGVSLDELDAAMVAMTIGGIDAHKSVTALRGVMTAFLKPSEDMKKALRSMGFSDPSQIIAAKGFEGALQAIANAADGMGSEIAKSVRNVRALTAELRLTSDIGAKKYQEALDAMQAASPEGLQKILSEFRSTDAERFQTQVNALKVNLTQDFGQAIVKILADMMQLMGGADKLAAAITAVAVAALPCVAALGALAAGLALVHLSLGPLGWAMLGLAAIMAGTAGAYTYQTLTTIANINKESEARHDAALKTIRDEEQKIAKWKESQEAEARKGQSNWSEEAAAIRRDYFKALDELKVKNQETVAGSRNVMESMISAQERVVAAYRNAANAAVRAVGESQSRALTLEAQYSDARFKFAQRGLDAEDQANNYRRRAMQEALAAAQQLAKAQTPDQIQAALAAFQRAGAAAKEAESLASATNDTQLRGDAERAVLFVMQQQIAAEKQLEQIQAAQAMKLAEKAAQEQERVNQMKTLMKSILADLQGFDKQGAKEPQALKAQQDRLNQNVAQFQRLFLQGEKVDVGSLLQLDQLQRRVATALEGGVSQAQIRQFTALPTAFADLRKQIEDGIGPIRVLIHQATVMNPQLAAEIQGMSAEESLTHLESRRMEARRQTINFAELEKRLSAAQNGLNDFASNAKADLDKWLTSVAASEVRSLNGATAWTDMSKQPLKDEAQRFVNAAQKFTRPDAQVTDADFQELTAAHDAYIKAIKPSAECKAAMQKVLDRALEVREQSKTVSAVEEAVQANLVPAVEAEQRVRDIDAALRAAKQNMDEVQKGTEGAYQGAQAVIAPLDQIAQTNMSGLTQQMNAAADATWRLVEAARAYQPPATAVEVATGGMMRWFDRGGFAPRGTDTIPAMLSPGEFVINAQSARKFYSQLVAINAGRNPIYREQGGSVTNITLGDINVTGGNTARSTARNIASELRRELRRGTSVL